MTAHIKLYSDKAERYEEVKSEITEKLGYEPSNPEVVGILMAGIDTDDLDIARTVTP